MPMTIAQAKGEDKTDTLEYNGAKLTFSYNPDAISHREWKRLRRLMQQAQEHPEDPDTDWVLPYLSQMLTGWDLVADATSKKPLPIDLETLDMLPMKLLSDLLTRIMEKLIPPEATSELTSGSFS